MHYTPLYERRKRLQNDLDAMGLNAEWVTDWDAEELTQDDIKTFYDGNEDAWKRKVNWQGNYSFRTLKKSEISLSIKHLKTMQKFLNTNREYALFLEDDAIFDEDFCQKFNLYFSEKPGYFDFIFIGNGCNLHFPHIYEKFHFYLKDYPSSRCTDSFIISRNACSKMIQHAIPFTLPIDFEINDVSKNNNLITYWLEPTLIKQGSQCGIYNRSI